MAAKKNVKCTVCAYYYYYSYDCRVYEQNEIDLREEQKQHKIL